MDSQTIRDALERHGGNQTRAAAELGVARSTIQHHMQKMHAAVKEPLIEHPIFPDDDVSAEEILDQMERRFSKRLEHANALRWFEVKVRDNLPLGINWFGDPHLGSNGCNVGLLRRDVALVARTPGMVGANIGDTADNWGGRLMRLYAENDVSKPTERKLARWFLQEGGIRWLLWLIANHDVMDPGFAAYLQGINGAQVPMVDWRARFRLSFPNGREARVDAAHDHKGHSQWNDLHGQERASVFDEFAHLYIAGHRHYAAAKQKEVADGQVVTLARVRGYKWLDDHAERNGFPRKEVGASVTTIIDPQAPSAAAFIRVFLDVEEGADYLGWLRKKRAS